MGKGEILLALKPKHNNTWEVAHGGVLLTLMDVAIAIAARSGEPGDRSVVTIEMKNNFMQAATGILRVSRGWGGNTLRGRTFCPIIISCC
jgi:uncharacterized protein (TIGR00369 family)